MINSLILRSSEICISNGEGAQRIVFVDAVKDSLLQRTFLCGICKEFFVRGDTLKISVVSADVSPLFLITENGHADCQLRNGNALLRIEAFWPEEHAKCMSYSPCSIQGGSILFSVDQDFHNAMQHTPIMRLIITESLDASLFKLPERDPIDTFTYLNTFIDFIKTTRKGDY